MPEVYAIQTRNLSKSFISKIVLNPLNFEVKTGEIFSILGANGAGKTTLIKILSTLWLPDSGSAQIFGYDLIRETSKIKPLISLVIGEERSFYWRLTGRQNLEFFAALYNLPSQRARKKIEEARKLFEIDNLDKRYDRYSTGMKQRIALARSFLTDAKLIFMDEPTRSLDPAAKFHFRRLMKQMVKENGVTLFF